MSYTSRLLFSSIQRLEGYLNLKISVREGWLLDIICALFVHYIYNRYEPQPINIFLTCFLLFIVPLLPSYFLLPQLQSAQTSFAVLYASIPVYVVFYATLLTSIAIYRISPFHPLAKFPGPRLARISNAWAVAIASTGKRHEKYKRLHDVHGPYVRVGPNELSCTDASAIFHLLGTHGLPKGPMWAVPQLPGRPRSIVAIPNAEEHFQRRKAWNRAVNTAAVKGYEEILEARIRQLAEHLEVYASSMCKWDSDVSVDLADWLMRFSFDFMGDMAFGGGFDLMAEGDKDGIMHVMLIGLKAITLAVYAPYLAPFIWKMPYAVKSIENLLLYCEKRVVQRLERGSKSKDLFHYLSNEDISKEVSTPFELIVADAAVAVVAGSDTTSTTLANAFFYLLANQESYSRLRKEVDTFFPPGESEDGIVESTKLAEMPYLNAVINESLRLQPAVPVAIQRTTLEEPKWTGSCYIPGGTAVNICPYAIHRDPKYFSPLPDTFWPDRWLPLHQRKCPTLQPIDASYSTWMRSGSKVDIENVITNTTAFMPFSFGPANCAGKNLAILEMRSVLCYLVRKFDMKFGMDGNMPYNQERWEKDRKDHITVQVGKLPVTLQRRQ